MIGNAHIDPVWLWRWQAGVDETLATFRSAADRCEEYPEYIFTRGESWVYEQVERLDPDLFGRVRGYVKSGRWHVTGGQYFQPDANLPTEARWRRQILHGQRYFEDPLSTTLPVARFRASCGVRRKDAPFGVACVVVCQLVNTSPSVNVGDQTSLLVRTLMEIANLYFPWSSNSTIGTFRFRAVLTGDGNEEVELART